MKLLVIEDEREIRENLVKGLKIKGYAVESAKDGEEGFDKAFEGVYDLIILDLNLPKLSGFEVLKRLRENDKNAKVLILSAYSDIDSKIKGFDLGTNDYLTKPFHFEELLARIRVLTMRNFTQESNEIQCGGVVIDTKTRVAMIKGNEISLTSKEFSILEYLAINKGRVISQSEIIAHVWKDDVDMVGSIRVHMSTLRKKIKAMLGEDIIKTKIGEGYYL